MLYFLLIALLFLVSLAGIILSKNLIRKVMALNMLNSAVIILFIFFGSLRGTHAPILVAGETDIVDPTPQALMLTAIVVGICITALALAFIYKLHHRYGTTELPEIERQVHWDD
ncbi:MAG: cation:proton antiporter subunit C [Spirochaetes bacterium]|nr:cation:proton antiporter subunit C [Spirochaetota bacterium]